MQIVSNLSSAELAQVVVKVKYNSLIVLMQWQYPYLP